jgi:hypothetical protein
VLLLALLAQGAAQAGAVTVRIAAPEGGAAVQEKVEVTASVTSEFALAQVVARVAGREGVLTGSLETGFRGTVDLTGVAPGPLALEVVARDVFGDAASALVPFTLQARDTPPRLEVLAPLEGTLARATLEVSVRCEDDAPGGCERVEVWTDSTPLTSSDVPGRIPGDEQLGTLERASPGSTTFSGTFCVEGLDGTQGRLRVVAFDASGQQAAVLRVVHVDRSPRLEPLAELGGPILDVDARRILFREPGRLLVSERATGAVTLLAEAPGTDVLRAALTPRGALFTRSRPGAPGAEAFEWADGQLSPVHGFQVNGDWALLERGTPGAPGHEVVLRRLSTGVEERLVAPGGAPVTPFAVSPDGDVAYSVPGTSPGTSNALVWRHDGRDEVVLTRGFYEVLQGVELGTDALAFVLQSATPSRPYRSPGVTLRTAAGAEETLTAIGVMNPDYLPWVGPHYRLDGGWVAFVDRTNGVLQVWRRAPDGTREQVSVFTSASTVDALGPNGEVLTEHQGRRYLPLPGQPPRELSSSIGVPRLTPAGWEVVLGRGLYRLHTGEAAPAQDAPACPTLRIDGPPDRGLFGCSQAGGGAGAASWLLACGSLLLLARRRGASLRRRAGRAQ